MFNSEFLADCDSNENFCISVGEAKDCLPGSLLDMIPEEYQDLDDDVEVCHDQIGDLLDEYGDIIHEFVHNEIMGK